MILLEGLGKISTIVADTGDLDSIRRFHPRDATTNPSIILKAVTENPEFLAGVIGSQPNKTISSIVDVLLVKIGCEILKLIPGRVSTEVDARVSFDAVETVEKAQRIIDLYRENNIPRERVLIKIAATWEGIQAARVLEMEGIHCNMTLVFSLEQAAACAEARATLISPFVGRILDWYRENEPTQLNSVDPGVASVRQIFHYYKRFAYKTEIMAASFRNIDEIISLAGCDLLTINPKLLEELSQKEGVLAAGINNFSGKFEQKLELGEGNFRLRLNENPMATEKLSEGIRNFCRDIRALENLIASHL